MIDAGTFQARSSQSGRRFEDECAGLLAACGWSIQKRKHIDRTGVEIDITASTPGGSLVFVECKGGEQDRPGAQRTDNVLKALGNALILHADGLAIPYVVLYSAEPLPGSVSERWLTLTGELPWLWHVPLTRDGQSRERLRLLAHEIERSHASAV